MCNPDEKTAINPTPYDEFCDCKIKFEDQTLKLSSPRWSDVEILHKIINGMNLPLENYPFKLCQSKTKIDSRTAAFATQFNGYPYIIYDPSKVNEGSIFAIYLMGHETGHILLWHPIVNAIPSVEKELEADFMAGVALHILGVSLQDAINVVSEDYEAEYPYSSGRERREAIKAGWLSRESNSINNSLAGTSVYGSPQSPHGNQ
jgi:hypothetical protein